MELQAGALSALMLGLRQAAEALDPDSNEFAGQPLEITGVGLISSPTSGKRALEVILDGTLRLILIVPEAAISPLHECLSALGEHPDG